MRRAALAGALVLAAGAAGAAQWTVTAARFDEPTSRYGHGVLGDAVEYGALVIDARQALAGKVPRSASFVVRLPLDRVFEDLAPRLADVDGDGRPEVIVVETSVTRGASLAVYDAGGKRAATAFIGMPHRWLAPAGVGDFDGDGRPEIAYVDRPHLQQDLVFLRLEGDRLVEVQRATGFTNHRIGDTAITSAVRACDGITEVVLPDAGWTRLVSVHLSYGQVVTLDAGPVRDLSGDRALPCP